MQDALGRESGRLPNLIGICWLIAWFWLTRYPVVLCKQDNIAGKSGRACTPFGALSFFAFPVLDAVTLSKRKKEKSLLCFNEPQLRPYLLLWNDCSPWKCQNVMILFFSLLQQPSLNQLCVCHYLKKSRLFHFRLFLRSFWKIPNMRHWAEKSAHLCVWHLGERRFADFDNKTAIKLQRPREASTYSRYKYAAQHINTDAQHTHTHTGSMLTALTWSKRMVCVWRGVMVGEATTEVT